MPRVVLDYLFTELSPVLSPDLTISGQARPGPQTLQLHSTALELLLGLSPSCPHEQLWAPHAGQCHHGEVGVSVTFFCWFMFALGIKGAGGIGKIVCRIAVILFL